MSRKGPWKERKKEMFKDDHTYDETAALTINWCHIMTS